MDSEHKLYAVIAVCITVTIVTAAILEAVSHAYPTSRAVPFIEGGDGKAVAE